MIGALFAVSRLKKIPPSPNSVSMGERCSSTSGDANASWQWRRTKRLARCANTPGPAQVDALGVKVWRLLERCSQADNGSQRERGCE
jgi:hypothetical protein